MIREKETENKTLGRYNQNAKVLERVWSGEMQKLLNPF